MAGFNKLFPFGLTFGMLFSFNAHDEVRNSMLKAIGIDREAKRDYLNLKAVAGDFKAKQEIFSEILKEKGPSPRFVNMVSEANLELLERTSLMKSTSFEDETKILTKKFKSYYPEVFDESSGEEFIKLLNLKTKCGDFYSIDQGKN